MLNDPFFPVMHSTGMELTFNTAIFAKKYFFELGLRGSFLIPEKKIVYEPIIAVNINLSF
jgi:hypothetical protein